MTLQQIVPSQHLVGPPLHVPQFMVCPHAFGRDSPQIRPPLQVGGEAQQSAMAGLQPFGHVVVVITVPWALHTCRSSPTQVAVFLRQSPQ
jgi:hypothetical protein